MFKDEESLPLTEVEDAIRDGDALLCVGYRCSEVGRHVIGALAGVGVGRIPFRGEFLDPALQVVSRRGIGIFCDDEAGTGVSDEDRADTGLDIGPFHRLGNGTGDLMKPASRSLKCDGFPEQIAPFCRTLRLIGKSNAPRIMYTTHRRRMGKKMSVIARFAILLLLPLVGCLDQGTGVPRSQSRPTTGVDALPRVVDNHPGENHFANIIQLTDGAENAEAYWSYNSQQFIFQSNRPPHSCDQIYTMDIDGGNIRQISSGEGRTTCAYFLSPDDTTVLWASTHLGSEECPPEPDRSQGYVWPIYSSYDVFTKKLPDGEVVRLTNNPGYDAEATVSPDGSRIVFTSMRDGDLDIYTMAPDGSDVVRLTSTPGYDGGPFFSPDGTKICYRARHPQGEELAEYQRLLKDGLVRPSRMDLFIMNSDGSGVFRITDNDAANFAPFFTPDGKSLLFSSNQGAGGGREFDIYKINIDGTGLEQVTTALGFDGFPMISPDGTRILFCSNRHNSNKGETNVFVADWLGGE